MTDNARSQKFEFIQKAGETVRLRVHLVAIQCLGGAAVTPPVVRYHAIATSSKEKHLAVPVIRGQRPTVRENDGLSGTPVLVVDLGSVLHCHGIHVVSFLVFVPCAECPFPQEYER